MVVEMTEISHIVAPIVPWLDAFDTLRDLDDPVWRSVVAQARQTTIPADTTVFREGDACSNFVLVLQGRIKVSKSFESGREMVLYRIGRGDTCGLTISTLIAQSNYAADAIAEEETVVALIRDVYFQQAFDDSKGFRDFVCRSFGRRIGQLISLLETVMARSVDARLAAWLLAHVDDDYTVAATHRELGTELGTAREVVSRKLKSFEQNGWVDLSRRTINVLDQSALHALIDGDGSSR